MKPLEYGSLRLNAPFGKTLALAFLLVVLLVGGAEVTARVVAAQAPGLVPSVGSRHRQFEISLARLYAAQRAGSLDCVFLGSSVVYRGIDPAIVAQSYQATAGQPIHCFNFGVSGLSATAAAGLAEIVVEQFHPALLVYGTTAHDYASALDAETVIEDTPWVRYQLGEPDAEGWLVDHSLALRYWLVYRDWMKPYYARSLRSSAQEEAQIRPDGFNPRQGTVLDAQGQLPAKAARRLARDYARYTRSPRQEQGLERLLALSTRGVRVVVVEMPVHPRMKDYFPHGAQDYQAFVETVGPAVERRGATWWRSAADIPDTGWYDLGHLNGEGAARLSEWLGARMASVAAAQGPSRVDRGASQGEP